MPVKPGRHLFRRMRAQHQHLHHITSKRRNHGPLRAHGLSQEAGRHPHPLLPHQVKPSTGECEPVPPPGCATPVTGVQILTFIPLGLVQRNTSASPRTSALPRSLNPALSSWQCPLATPGTTPSVWVSPPLYFHLVKNQKGQLMLLVAPRGWRAR